MWSQTVCMYPNPSPIHGSVPFSWGSIPTSLPYPTKFPHPSFFSLWSLRCSPATCYVLPGTSHPSVFLGNPFVAFLLWLLQVAVCLS